MNMKIIYPGPDLLDKTIEIAVKNSLTFYDAMYIAVAEENDAILYTGDSEIVPCRMHHDCIRHIKDYI